MSQKKCKRKKFESVYGMQKISTSLLILIKICKKTSNVKHTKRINAAKCYEKEKSESIY